MAKLAFLLASPCIRVAASTHWRTSALLAAMRGALDALAHVWDGRAGGLCGVGGPFLGGSQGKNARLSLRLSASRCCVSRGRKILHLIRGLARKSDADRGGAQVADVREPYRRTGFRSRVDKASRAQIQRVAGAGATELHQRNPQAFLQGSELRATRGHGQGWHAPSRR